MSDYFHSEPQAIRAAELIGRALPDAMVTIHEWQEWQVCVTLPDGQRVDVGDSGDLAGDIADLKALAEEREP